MMNRDTENTARTLVADGKGILTITEGLDGLRDRLAEYRGTVVSIAHALYAHSEGSRL